MAKKPTPEIETAPPAPAATAPPAPLMQQQQQTPDDPNPPPLPANRMVKAGMVRVRAVEPVCEFVNGDRVVIAAGEGGEIPEARLAALGPLVTRLP